MSQGDAKLKDFIGKLQQLAGGSGMALTGEVDVVRKGEKIILPEDMSYDEAIEWLQRRKKEEMTKVAISETIEAFPLDGAVAFSRVLQQKYGWTDLVPTPGFFGDEPPAMIGVDVGPNQSVQVAWGRCQVPKISGWLECGFEMKEGRPLFRLVGEVMRMDEKAVHQVAELVRKQVREQSIYRGKAIKMNFRRSDGQRLTKFDPSWCPKFMPMDGIDENGLILSAPTMKMVTTSLYNPVEHSERCRKRGIPLKRGVLMEGPFGTGKTLTAHILAKKCVRNGWTFLYLQDVRDLDLALNFAKLYEPAVVFAEDVDRIVGDERNDDMNQILNLVDGVDSKHHEIMVVLTTNKIEVIHPAFIRPGRIDAVITIEAPDLDTTMRLVRHYAGSELHAEDAALSKAVKPLVGNNAAVIREAVERSKLAAISHDEGNGSLKINADDIGTAAHQMAKHLALLNKTDDSANQEFRMEELRFRVPALARNGDEDDE